MYLFFFKLSYEYSQHEGNEMGEGWGINIPTKDWRRPSVNAATVAPIKIGIPGSSRITSINC